MFWVWLKSLIYYVFVGTTLCTIFVIAVSSLLKVQFLCSIFTVLIELDFFLLFMENSI